MRVGETVGVEFRFVVGVRFGVRFEASIMVRFGVKVMNRVGLGL